MYDPSRSAEGLPLFVTDAGQPVRLGAAAAAASGARPSTGADQTSDLVCAAAYPFPGGGWARCGAAATMVWLYGCVHEHLVQLANCPDHEPRPGIVGCRLCFDAGHECALALLRRIS